MSALLISSGYAAQEGGCQKETSRRAAMGKTPNFEDWKWPWKQGEVDEEKAAKMIHKLKVGFEDQQDLVQERDERIAALTDELESAKAAKSGTDAEAQEELKELRKENRTLKNAEAKSLPADEK